MSTLKLHHGTIDTYRENVAYLHHDCPYRSEGFQALSRIEIHKVGNGPLVIAVLNVVDHPAITSLDELGLSEQAFQQIGLPEGSAVQVRHAAAPRSLTAVRQKIAGERLEQADYRSIARDILDSGRALAKLEAIIQAQGANPESPGPGRLQHPVVAGGDGVVAAVDNLQLVHIAQLAGAPMDKGAGIDLHKKVGEPVCRGEPLYTIHAEFQADFEFAIQAARENTGYGTAR